MECFCPRRVSGITKAEMACVTRMTTQPELLRYKVQIRTDRPQNQKEAISQRSQFSQEPIAISFSELSAVWILVWVLAKLRPLHAPTKNLAGFIFCIHAYVLDAHHLEDE